MNREFKPLVIPLIVLAGILAMGTVGFHLIEGWTFFDAFYMSLITITTIGYSELAGLSGAGRVLNSMLILLGVGTFTYAVSQMVNGLVQRQLVETLRNRTMQKMVNKLNDHFIVCGAGRVGMRIAQKLQHSKVPFVVIEEQEAVVERLKEQNIRVVYGCATEELVLRRAGIERAKGLATAIGSDPENVYISLMARELNPTVCIVARANSAEVEPRLRQAGANRVISPDMIGSRQMANALLKPVVLDFFEDIMDDSEIGIDAIIIAENCELSGLTLREAQLSVRFGINVIRVRQVDGMTLNSPSGDTVLNAGDHLVVVGSNHAIERLNELCT